MTPAKYNINIWRGATKPLEFRFPLNLTGYTAALYYKDLNNITQTITLNLTEYQPNPVKWAAKAELTPTQTRAMPLGKSLNYEVQLRSASGKEYVYLQGSLIIQGGISVDG